MYLFTKPLKFRFQNPWPVNKKALSILHVDDDQVDCMVIRKVLKNQGISEEIIQASNGEEALQLLQNRLETQSRLPDLILLDINMPRMNGLELLQSIRSDERLCHLPVFVLTTSDDSEDRQSAFRMNVAGYFLKGLDMAEQERTFSVLKSYWELNRFTD